MYTQILNTITSQQKRIFKNIFIDKQPSGLRHELSSLAWTLGSWVSIPTQGIYVWCVFMFILSLCSVFR
jgi:hypothetical protein